MPVPLLSACLQNNCQRVGATAKQSHGKRQWLSVCYDQACRESWSSRAYNNDSTLNVELEATKLRAERVMRAIEIYDEIEVASHSLHVPRLACLCLALRGEEQA